MGAGPSTERGSATASAEPKKVDYYDLLGVDRLATDDEYAHNTSRQKQTGSSLTSHAAAP